MLHNLNCSIALYKALSITAAAAQLVNGSSLAEALAYILRKGRAEYFVNILVKDVSETDYTVAVETAGDDGTV